METLKNKIRESRNIKEKSLNAYMISLRKLHDKIKPNEEFGGNLDFLKSKEKVISVLDDMKLSTRKNYIAAIIVALNTDKEKYENEIKTYRTELDEVAKEYKNGQEEQQKTEKEAENWVSLKKLRKVLSKYKKEIMERGILKKNKDELTNKEFQLLQMWVLGNLYVMDDNPPLRNDYIMKVITKSEYDKLTDKQKEEQNYLVVQSRNKKFFSLGEYKTAKKYGTKKMEISSKINSLLNIWLSFNKSGYLFLNSKKEPISANGLTKLLNKTFEPTGKSNISSTMLRHIFISEKIGGPTLKEKQELADKMGHSVNQQELYKKK